MLLYTLLFNNKLVLFLLAVHNGKYEKTTEVRAPKFRFSSFLFIDKVMMFERTSENSQFQKSTYSCDLVGHRGLYPSRFIFTLSPSPFWKSFFLWKSFYPQENQPLLVARRKATLCKIPFKMLQSQWLYHITFDRQKYIFRWLNCNEKPLVIERSRWMTFEENKSFTTLPMIS